MLTICHSADKLTKNQPQTQLIPVSKLIESVRSVKSPEELALCSKAAALADSVIEYARSIVRPGLSEKEIAWYLEKWLRENGSDPIPFEIIVASGPNSALPHAKPSERTVNCDEPILIDLGAKVNGYGSDITRTFCIGKESDTFINIYDIVLGAQLTALATIKSGMTGEQADKLARIVIEQAGHGNLFGHSLGHGVGLETHESPLLGPRSQETLVDGNVFTRRTRNLFTRVGRHQNRRYGYVEEGQSRNSHQSKQNCNCVIYPESVVII